MTEVSHCKHARFPQFLVRENPLVVHSALLSETTANQISGLTTTIGDSTSYAPGKQSLALGTKLRVLLFERHDDARGV